MAAASANKLHPDAQQLPSQVVDTIFVLHSGRIEQ